MTLSKKQEQRKLRREAIAIQNKSSVKLSMAEATKLAKHRRENPTD